jgi:hypothetical protein
MSMRDGQTGQESGILGSTGNPFIGPAPRDYYNPAQWALVPSTSAAEILLDPDPDQRQRDTSKGEPVFMKPLPNKDPLASLITILGHIPLARNSLVAGPTLANYGSSPDWWKGAKIELSVISHEEEEHFRLSYELLEETQRLMAFMHSSTRSYGSVQPLSELKAVTNVKSGMAEFKTLADRFLAAWSDASIALSLLPPNLPNLFLTKALQLSANGKKDEIPFYIIDIKLGPTDTTAPTRTLYDGADGLLWAEDLDGTMDDNYCLEEIPPVLAMRVLNQDASNTGLDMEVLETWYLDRYLKKNMIAAKTMRNQRSNYTKELQNIEERRKKFLRIKHPKGDKEFEAKELIASTIKYLNPPKPTDKENAKPGESSNENAPAQEPQSVEQLRSVELANQLAGILEKVDKKLKGTVCPYMIIT